MKTINFLNKIAFICNICFLLCFLITKSKFLNELPNLISIIGVLGFLAIIINSLMLVISLVVIKKPTLKKATVLLNAMLFIIQFYYYFIL